MKYFWGVRELLGDGFNLTLTLKVMSREDSRLGQHRDLDLKKKMAGRGSWGKLQPNRPEEQSKHWC